MNSNYCSLSLVGVICHPDFQEHSKLTISAEAWGQIRKHLLTDTTLYDRLTYLAVKVVPQAKRYNNIENTWVMPIPPSPTYRAAQYESLLFGKHEVIFHRIVEESFLSCCYQAPR